MLGYVELLQPFFTYKNIFLSDMASEYGREQQVDVSMSQHVLVCALGELGILVESLDTSAAPLVSEPSTGKHFIIILTLSI